MGVLKARRQYFELDQNLENQNDFLSSTERTKQVSGWAAEQLGLSDQERDSYIQGCVGDIVRENAVLSMLKKIERDLFEANLEIEQEEIHKKFYGH